MSILKEYKDYLIENNILHKKLFTHLDGTLFMPDIFNKWLDNYSNVINRYTIHSIRHTNLSYLISYGVDPVTVAKRAGHSSVSTTLDIYSYVFNHIDRKAADTTTTMDRLGFSSYDEYYVYLDFIKTRNKRI